MKRYLLIGDYRGIQMKDAITKEDLIRLAQKYLDWVIDTAEGTYFDAASNEWKKIEDWNE